MKNRSENVSKPKSGGATRQLRESVDLDTVPANDAVPREQCIAVAAYFRAEQRGFVPGNRMFDLTGFQHEKLARSSRDRIGRS